MSITLISKCNYIKYSTQHAVSFHIVIIVIYILFKCCCSLIVVFYLISEVNCSGRSASAARARLAWTTHRGSYRQPGLSLLGPRIEGRIVTTVFLGSNFRPPTLYTLVKCSWSSLFCLLINIDTAFLALHLLGVENFIEFITLIIIITLANLTDRDFYCRFFCLLSSSHCSGIRRPHLKTCF